MNKKELIGCLALSFLFLISIKSFARTIYDMQKINVNVTKPISKFTIEYQSPSGDKGKITSNSDFYDSDLYTFDMLPSKVTFECGTKIKIIDESESGSGNKISKYDFQIYTPSFDRLINTSKKSEIENEMILNEIGEYNFYLSVMDDYKNVAGFDNWSVNGNHRWLSQNQKNKNEMFYWYFSQIQINVISRDLITETGDLIDINEDENDKDKTKEEDNEDDEEKNKNVEDINHNPEVEIIGQDIYYPNEIINNTNLTNYITWFYYDEDGDKMESSGFELYKYQNNKKVLIDKKDDITKRRECFIYINGEMNDKFVLDVYVVDEEGNKGENRLEITIDELMPNIYLNVNDRSYLNDELNIDFEIKDDEVDKNLIINYKSWSISLDDKTILSGKDKVTDKLYIDSKKFEENKTYKISQIISNSYGSEKILCKKFFIVPIEKPVLNMNNVTLYYDEEKETGLEIIQPQSALKGNLYDYTYEFKNSNGYYEIYLDGKKIFQSEGLLYTFIANETNNIKYYDEEKIYEIYQYAKNDRDKEGVIKINALVKPYKNDFIELKILERDNDPLTIKNEIYPNEYLNFKSNYFSKDNVISKKGYIKNINDEIIYTYEDLLDGLIKMNLKPGEYIAEDVIITNEKTLNTTCKFIVKKISNPVIKFNGLLNYNNTKLDNVNAYFDVYDVNKSEEHPFGYELDINYFVNDEAHDGKYVINDFSKYISNSKYNIVQYAFNKEHVDIVNSLNKEFYLENILPQIISNNYDEYDINETCNFEMYASDLDGYLTDFDVKCVSNNVIDLKIKDNKENNKWVKEISFDSNGTGCVTFEITASDNDGDTTYKIINININDNGIYPYIKLINDDEKIFKINRYMQIEYGSEIYNDVNLYFNDLKNKIEFNEDNIYENEYIKMILEQNDNNKIAGLYFKQEGNYKILCKIESLNYISKERYIDFKINNDEIPQIVLICDENIYRDSHDNRAKLKLKYEIHSDDEIDYIKTYSNNKEIEMNNDTICFETNELGTKNIKLLIQEKHNYMPSESHPFYNELKEKMKYNFSNEKIICIDNLKPEINCNLKRNKKILLIE